MNKMADNVLSKMEQKQKYEETMLAKYEAEREMFQRDLEMKREARKREDQQKMRDFLA